MSGRVIWRLLTPNMGPFLHPHLHSGIGPGKKWWVSLMHLSIPQVHVENLLHTRSYARQEDYRCEVGIRAFCVGSKVKMKVTESCLIPGKLLKGSRTPFPPLSPTPLLSKRADGSWNGIQAVWKPPPASPVQVGTPWALALQVSGGRAEVCTPAHT